MEKYTKRFSPEEIQEILNKYMGVKNTRIVSLYTHGGLGWGGVDMLVYDDPEPEPEKTDEEDMGLEDCLQCGEAAWDGYICHSCGAKNI